MKANKFEFSEEGATVSVPEQRKKLRVVKRPLGKLSDMKPKPGGFSPWRLVFNFEMEDEDHPGTFVHEFDEPLELRIRYNRNDFERAEKAGKPLRLGFWDGSQWVAFETKKHKFQVIPAADVASGGELVALLSRWSDPPIGIGI